MTAPLLALDKVSVRYASRRSAAVEDVSISIEAGRTLGIVGESGCGKSTLAKAVMGLVPVSAGLSSTMPAMEKAPMARAISMTALACPPAP